MTGLRRFGIPNQGVSVLGALTALLRKSRELDAGRAHHVLAVLGHRYEVERAATKRETRDRETDSSVCLSLRVEHAAPLLAELKTVA